jgi:uncharacterized protein YdaU (DUF1376 family)
MHYYQFNIGDYLKQTAHLTPMEDICYRRLLDMYYETESRIPTETDWVSRRLRLGSDLVMSVLKEFFFLTENGWENARCEADIAAYKAKANTAKTNGKLGGRPKKTQLVILANQSETESKANQEPLTINQEPFMSTTGVVDNKARAKKFDAMTHLMDLGVSRQVADDWIAHRKTKRASITETSIKGIEREAGKAGISLEQALSECCQRGWQGFKAEWMAQAGGQKPAMTQHQLNQQAIARSIGLIPKNSPDPFFGRTFEAEAML